MILKNRGESIHTNCGYFDVGQKVIGNVEADEYEGLTGYITEIRTDEDRDTENETEDIYVCFDVPDDPELIKRVEADFSESYGEPKTIDEIPLDMVIMAPDMLDAVPQEYKIEVTAYPSIITVTAKSINEAEEFAQELWETEPTNREVDGVHVLEIDGVPFNGFAGQLSEMFEMAKTYGDEFKVVYWHSSEDRDAGDSETEDSGLSIEDAYALYMDIRCDHLSTEIQVDNDDQTVTILFHGPATDNNCVIETWQINRRKEDV